ncbi:unnamed protein product [Symbiodinium sp. CCMP2592]|nr:unnamed protein product [Symbiodinium sp. CCMP2592]
MSLPLISQLLCPIRGPLIQKQGPYPSDRDVRRYAAGMYAEYCEYCRGLCGRTQDKVTELLAQFEAETQDNTAAELLWLLEYHYVRIPSARTEVREFFSAIFECTVEEYMEHMARQGFGTKDVEIFGIFFEEDLF